MKAHEKQAALFLTLVAFVIITLAAAYVLNALTLLTVLVVVLIFLLVTYTQVHTFFVQLREYERAVVFHLGKFDKVIGPGWFFLIPFVQTYVKVDLRTKTIDIRAQEVITNDNIKIKADAIIYMKVKDPKAAILNVDDYERAATTFIQASLREVLGKMPLATVIAMVDVVNKRLAERLKRVSVDWGINIDSVELQDIQLPEVVQTAMHERKTAEQKKLAAIEIAEGRKITINAIQEAAGKLTDSSLQYLYLQALEKIAEGKSNKIIFPLELSKLAAGISSKLGESFPKAQHELVGKYEKLRKRGMKKDRIIDELRKEYALPKTTTRKKPKKRRR
jgi:regulator of protease activity HflC (stomatin/prohibitin superfamily)